MSLNYGSKGIDLKHIGALQFSFSADSLFVLCQMREKGYFEHFDEIQAWKQSDHLETAVYSFAFK